MGVIEKKYANNLIKYQHEVELAEKIHFGRVSFLNVLNYVKSQPMTLNLLDILK